MASGLFLRVLDGLHQGASVPLASFPAGVQLAAAGPADVLLRDAPGQARLTAGEGAWLWQEDGFSQALEIGAAWRWGATVLGLAHADAPWPHTLPVLAFDRPQVLPPPAAAATPASEPVTDSEAEQAIEPLPAAVLAEADAPRALPGRAPARAKAGWTAARMAWVLGGVMLALLLALALGSSLLAPPVAQTPLTQPASTEPVDLAKVTQLLNAMEMNDLVQPKLRPDGRLLIKGVVPDDERLDALAVALRKLTRGASLWVITQAEFAARVNMLQQNLPEGIRAVAQDKGQLVLQGVDGNVDWVLARQLVDGEIPEVVWVLHQAANAPVPSARAVEAEPASSAPAPARDAAFPLIPRIAAIMGGASPYLMLEQGLKWLPGGKVGGLTLQAIEDQSLVFEDAQGRIWRRPR